MPALTGSKQKAGKEKEVSKPKETKHMTRYDHALLANYLRYGAIALLLASLSIQTASAQASWSLQHVPVQTRWAKEVGPDNALREYPRPQMTRPGWTNLNGLWDYAITKKEPPVGGQAQPPTRWDGKILVPFPIESALSGIKKALLPDENLWYKRTFKGPRLKSGERVLLHFGAVDWQTTVYINGKEAGTHTGGYTEFTLAITDLQKPGDNELAVKVYDPTDEGIGPHGKQTLQPGGIVYTATSGIWQTVWLETVPKDYVQCLTITPNVDSSFVAVTVHANVDEPVQLAAGGDKISGRTNQLIKLPIVKAHLWSPEDPYLYDLDVKTGADEVKSYFGMRKINIDKDDKGIDRIFLNNKPYYNLGVLDQGFWPDGLYAAPTDEALAFDIMAIKAMGFNTIRKHIKVEPARWYYWADKLGVLVWQDMVNPNEDLPEGSKAEFERESKETLEQLHNYPCITTWVLFNEGWGQYDQKRLTEWVKQTDPSRLVDGHTGEIQYFNGALKISSADPYPGADLTDVHSYSDPMMPIKQAGKAQVLGEFGGIGVSIAGHEWNSIKGLRYTDVEPGQYEGKYHFLVENLAIMKAEGLSGSIFTQPYDVEGEENGLMTYDREVAKIPIKRIREINELLNPDAGKNIPRISISNADTSDLGERYARLLDDYRRGNRQPEFLRNLAFMAYHAGNKYMGNKVADSYIQTLSGTQLNENDIRFINQFTTSTHEPGFAIIQTNQKQFKNVLGDRPLTSALMNMIYHGEIEESLKSDVKPDWTAISTRVKPYGEPGQEILLRTETIYYLNKQDWRNYLPTVKTYLEKYGKNLPAQDQKTFRDAIQQYEKSDGK